MAFVLSLTGSDVASRKVFGHPLHCRDAVLRTDKVIMAFRGRFPSLIAGVVVRDGQVVFSAGKEEWVRFLRCKINSAS